MRELRGYVATMQGARIQLKHHDDESSSEMQRELMDVSPNPSNYKKMHHFGSWRAGSVNGNTNLFVRLSNQHNRLFLIDHDQYLHGKYSIR
jgi:hypothetical protein